MALCVDSLSVIFLSLPHEALLNSSVVPTTHCVEGSHSHHWKVKSFVVILGNRRFFYRFFWKLTFCTSIFHQTLQSYNNRTEKFESKCETLCESMTTRTRTKLVFSCWGSRNVNKTSGKLPVPVQLYQSDRVTRKYPGKRNVGPLNVVTVLKKVRNVHRKSKIHFGFICICKTVALVPPLIAWSTSTLTVLTFIPLLPASPSSVSSSSSMKRNNSQIRMSMLAKGRRRRKGD